MTKYYVRILILFLFLFFSSKTQEFEKEKLRKYGSISLNENIPENSAKNQDKNEKGSSQKRQLGEWEPIRIFVDLKPIITDGISNEYNNLNLSVIESAVDEVKKTLAKLVNVIRLTENLKITDTTLLNTYIDSNHFLVVY